MLFYKLKFFIFLFFVVGFLFFNFANAQTVTQTTSRPQFMVSWQAQSYAPSWYQGKIFPTKGSRINVVFELIDNGKIADLSKLKVRWYLNDKLVLNEKNGLGVKSYSFQANDYAGQDAEIRIAIIGYKGGEQIGKIITIPIAYPEAVIDAPYSDLQINRGTTLLGAYPFFFNVSDLKNLSFNWNVNNQVAEVNDINRQQALDLNIDQKAPSGFIADIKLTVRNLLDEMSFASDNVKLNIK